MNFFKKLWHFVVWHPVWAMIITWFAFYIICSMSGGNQTPESSLILTLIAYLFLSIFIRKSRDKKHAEERAKAEQEQKEKDMDELARRIAIEKDKIDHPEKYN